MEDVLVLIVPRSDQRSDIVDDDDLRLAPWPVVHVLRTGVIAELGRLRCRRQFQQRLDADVTRLHVLECELRPDAGRKLRATRSDRTTNNDLRGLDLRGRSLVEECLQGFRGRPAHGRLHVGEPGQIGQGRLLPYDLLPQPSGSEPDGYDRANDDEYDVAPG